MITNLISLALSFEAFARFGDLISFCKTIGNSDPFSSSTFSKILLAEFSKAKRRLLRGVSTVAFKLNKLITLIRH